MSARRLKRDLDAPTQGVTLTRFIVCASQLHRFIFGRGGGGYKRPTYAELMVPAPDYRCPFPFCCIVVGS